MTTYKNRFFWDSETLEHFKAVAQCDPKNVYEQIKNFVHNECDLEEGESFAELIFDLTQQIKK